MIVSIIAITALVLGLYWISVLLLEFAYMFQVVSQGNYPLTLDTWGETSEGGKDLWIGHIHEEIWNRLSIHPFWRWYTLPFRAFFRWINIHPFPKKK